MEPAQVEQELYFCNYCSKKANFFCSNCQEAAYCKLEHQKADWIAHKPKCISHKQKIKRHLAERTYSRKQIFARLARKQFFICQQINETILKKQQQFLLQFQSNWNEIEYASTLLLHVRLMILMRDFNKAQDILNKFYVEKKSFLENVTIIPKQFDQKHPQYQKMKDFVKGKIRIISTLANLTHQLIRNSIHIVEILIKHIQYFYGSQSLELANCYFETGMYFNYMTQFNKAIACFLKAGKLRKQKGAVCYYNAALLLVQTGQQMRALRFFNKSLNLLQNNPQVNHKQLKAYIYQNIGIIYCHMQDIDKITNNFETALCLHERRGQKNHPHFNLIINLLRAIKKQSDADNQQTKNYRFIQLAHQKFIPKKSAQITNADFDLFWNADKNKQKDQKIIDWKQSFNNFKKKIKLQKSGPQIPSFVQKIILKGDKQANYDQQNTRNLKSFENVSQTKIVQHIEVNLQFMSELTGIEVQYLHQLNIRLGQVKDKNAMYDILENSNFLRKINSQKRQTFFKLNPNLVKPLNTKDKKKMVTPRLNLQSMKKVFDEQQNY